MKYTKNGKTFIIPDNEIDEHVENLGISIAEACEMYLTDNDLITDETVEKLSENARKNRVTQTIHDAKGEKKPRKAREKKENPLKRAIINALFDGLEAKVDTFNAENCHFTIENDEKYINLDIDGRLFTVNLVEHRRKK